MIELMITEKLLLEMLHLKDIMIYFKHILENLIFEMTIYTEMLFHENELVE